ncbi:MAG TPA: hypothetical protein PKY77_05940 [Phycisphaerae bacterium]|nr:hypothetical protein [Phycisphaerae bacterium]HRY69014.1 hypothetical protein [Phycisphaerae bacterium]
MWRDKALRPGTAPPPLAESRFLFNRQRQSNALQPPVKPSRPSPKPPAKPGRSPPINRRVDDNDEATQVKSMRFKNAPRAGQDNAFIHSTLGIRYLRFYVTDLTAVLNQAAPAGATPIAKPCALSPDPAEGDYLVLVRDPDGNMIELIGPPS